MKEYPMFNLQLFAGEDESTGAEDLDQEQDSGAEDNDDGEVLKFTQEELNGIIESRLSRYKEETLDQLKQQAISEAEKLSSMNEMEKIQHQNEQLEQELEELRAERSKQELISTAKDMLSAKNINLSDELVSKLITDKADTTKDNVSEFIKMFDDAVSAEVDKITKSETPPRMGNTQDREQTLSFAERANKMRITNK